MGGFAKSFRELDVYKMSYECALEIFRISKDFPQEEKYHLTSQVRDSSRSVCANIGEAWGKRKYPKHFCSKLTDAKAEAHETTVWIDFSLDHKYIEKEIHSELREKYDVITGKLNKMIDNTDDWAI